MVIHFIRLIALSTLTSLLLVQSAFALTQVTATVDKNPVMEKESFILQVIADDDVGTNALDTSPLLKDFIVGRTSVSSQTSMVNFNTTRTTKWTTVLIARTAGTFMIPALTIESLSTSPISLEVLKTSNQKTSASQDIFITTDVSSKEVYVQEQLTLTVKLHFAAELKRGSLSEPTLDGASITQIGKDKESDTIINGKRYRVIERNYAINPQNSGNFIIKTPVFSGEIISQTNRRSNFLSFADTKPVSALGEDINLTVKPIPDNYQGFWLPSEILTLHQEWQPDNESFMVGDPITRTVILTAAGLSEEQLPKVEMSVPSGIKVYPDQAELHTGMNNNKLVSQKKQNFALVASKIGTYELPEIRIPWWNTVTNKMQYAVIPAKSITITPNEDMANDKQNNNATNSTAQAIPTTVNENKPLETKTVIVKEASWLQWLFLALWLLTSFAWLISSFNKKKKNTKTIKAVSQSSYKDLINACDKNNGEEALQLIAPWAAELFSSANITTLEEAKHFINRTEFNQAVMDLQQCFYGKVAKSWNGNTLKSLIIDINKHPKNIQNQPITLNP
ncbi:BatD family protein [Colwellia sp. UCD-KL20]|uniref:BatD family protein n=1 Tax=Colwellia sp. UCD-KL20 TaxID=1917165 RepID=UPI001178755B|nr:BatD family protein [Colwellia sp. UCD-KL20]